MSKNDTKIKMKQVVIAPWQGDNNRLSFSVFALGEDGRVYKHAGRRGGWAPYSMRLANYQDGAETGPVYDDGDPF